MSNFRWNVGLGPIRYSRQIGRPRKEQEPEVKKGGCLTLAITVVVTLALIYGCCTGAVWYVGNATP